MTTPEPRQAPERILRFVLLCLLWAAWLALRGLWVLLEWLVSRDGRRALRRGVGAAALVAGMALQPKVGGLLWGRMMLQDALEIAAMQSEGRADGEIAWLLRQRAFELGFQDIATQTEVVRVERTDPGDGPLCLIEMDFRHRLDLYGWASPALRIHLKAQKTVYPRPQFRSIEDLL